MRTRIEPVNREPSIDTWARQYHDHLLANRRLTAAALAEMKRSGHLLWSAVGPPTTVGGLVAGAVVGAVQSGKTGLMVDLAARAMDGGFKLIVVLTGLKDDLRSQTALRFVRDLLQRGDKIRPGDGDGFTHPLGIGCHGWRRDCWAPSYWDDVNHDEAFVSLMSSRLQRGDSVLAVAKKNVATLARLREAYLYACGNDGAARYPLLILDDECDEASVSSAFDAPTPERIAGLWSGLGQSIAYVGFTATPAASLLQDTGSVLFPRDFVLTMRSPGSEDSVLSYFEPEVDRRYCGGELFYEYLDHRQRQNFLVRTDMSWAEFDGHAHHTEELEEALIAYFVAGAIRLLEQPGKVLAGEGGRPAPHSMMAHTESKVESHWDLCAHIIGVTRSKAGRSPIVKENPRRMKPQDRLRAADLGAWLTAEQDRWKKWHEDYHSARRTTEEVLPDRTRPPFPEWSDVVAVLPTVFDAVKLRVVNSDENASDLPIQFEPSFVQGVARPPRDVYSIFIGGNRLSRGLTVEGLCTSYYTRSSAILLEDATVQRERWFGYRGRHLEFCRVFTHRDLAIRLRRFHEHDEDLRRQLAWNIEHERGPVDSTLRFLTLSDSQPTAKMGRGRGPLSIDVSGSRLFVDRVQMGLEPDELKAAAVNEALAARIAADAESSGEELKDQSGRRRGLALLGVPTDEISDILDSLAYAFHNPDPGRGIAWGLREYHRAPRPDWPVTEPGFSPRSDPFLIAAYLRYWSRAYQRCQSFPGVNPYRGADSVSSWIPVPPPMFNLVVRIGSLTPESGSPFKVRLLDREVDRRGLLSSRWGGRGYSGPGDEWIDLTPTRGVDAPRAAGEPGLALLHVIGRQALGRSSQGKRYEHDRPCFGLVVPEGGPCIQFVLADEGS